MNGTKAPIAVVHRFYQRVGISLDAEGTSYLSPGELIRLQYALNKAQHDITRHPDFEDSECPAQFIYKDTPETIRNAEAWNLAEANALARREEPSS